MTAEELTFSKTAVQNYNRLKELIWSGDLYRLISPYEEERSVLMYISQDKSRSLLFSYALHPRFSTRFSPVRLNGLDPNKSYKLNEINKMPGIRSFFPSEGKTFSGDYLMKIGVSLPNNNQLTSAVIEITEAK